MVVIVATVSGDGERPVWSRREHQYAGVFTGLGTLPVEECAGKTRCLAVRIVEEKMTKSLELVEDDEVRLKRFHARRCEQTAKLPDQGVPPSRLIARYPVAGPPEVVTECVEAIADRRVASVDFVGDAVVEGSRKLF